MARPDSAAARSPRVAQGAGTVPAGRAGDESAAGVAMRLQGALGRRLMQERPARRSPPASPVPFDALAGFGEASDAPFGRMRNISAVISRPRVRVRCLDGPPDTVEAARGPEPMQRRPWAVRVGKIGHASSPLCPAALLFLQCAPLLDQRIIQ